MENKGSVSELITRIKASDVFAEGLAAQLIAAAETTRHMAALPMSYGLTSEQVGVRPTGETGQFLFDHMGDAWEVANLFMATRLALVVVSKTVETVTHKHIPDEACFWASMAVGVSIPALMEMGLLKSAELGGSLPFVFEQADLFGIGVSALVLTATHYVSKYREELKDKASRLKEKISTIGSGKFMSSMPEESDTPVKPPSQDG